MDKIEKYIDELLEKSTPDRPIWNIEKILQGKKSTWNYIDGCMIKAILEMYAITKDEKYFSFADHFIDCKVMEDGSIEGYSVEELNIDNVNAGKTLFALYALNGKEKYRKAIDLAPEEALFLEEIDQVYEAKGEDVQVRYDLLKSRHAVCTKRYSPLAGASSSGITTMCSNC